jgi:hypothetical protein
VQENHRRTLAVNRVVDLDAIGFDFAATVRGDRRRGRRQGLPSLSGERRQRYAGDERGEGELAREIFRKETIQRLYTTRPSPSINLGPPRE